MADEVEVETTIPVAPVPLSAPLVDKPYPNPGVVTLAVETATLKLMNEKIIWLTGMATHFLKAAQPMVKQELDELSRLLASLTAQAPPPL